MNWKKAKRISNRHFNSFLRHDPVFHHGPQGFFSALVGEFQVADNDRPGLAGVDEMVDSFPYRQLAQIVLPLYPFAPSHLTSPFAGPLQPFDFLIPINHD